MVHGFVRSSRLALIGLVTATMAAAVILPVSPASAAAGDPTLTVVDSGGTPSTAVAVGDDVNTKTSAPITRTGQTGQRIVTTWNPVQATVNPASIVTPEGWSKEFTSNGTTWSSSAPSDPTTISGVRSEGSVNSDGYASGLQVSTATGTGTVQSGASTFSGASGGDGWDATATSSYVLNVWHHNTSSYNLDCHVKATGASCGAVYSLSGYTTSRASSIDVAGTKVYSVVGETSSNSSGVLCTDISALPFSSCGYTALSTGDASVNNLGGQTMSGTKVYSALASGALLCFDTSTNLPCVSQPYTLAGFSSTLSNIPTFAISDSGYVFITANKIWCITSSSGSPCTGSWPVGSFSGSVHSAIPARDSGGTLTGVCMILPAGTCYDLSGASATYPAALTTLLTSKPVEAAAAIGWGQYDFNATRQYWLTGSGWGSADYPVCWDWATQAACAGFATTASTGVVRYALRLDDTNQNCAWTNGDNGQISSFDTSTGAAGCSGPDPVVVVPYSTAVPRMGCAEAGRVRAFRDLTLTTPSGTSRTALKVTVRNSTGAALTGFIDLHPSVSGVIDLSALDPAATGTHPSFEITSPGTSTTDAAAITAAVRYDSDVAQLCLTLTPVQNCPALTAGQSSTPTVPVSALTINAQSVAIVSGVETPTALTQSPTRAGMANCLGSVSGVATLTYPAGSIPFQGGTVRLIAPDTSVVTSTTTASDGSYSFANINPASYTVSLAGQAPARTVTATANSTANFNVPVAAPTAAPIFGYTLQNSPSDLAIQATADPLTSVIVSSVRLYNTGTSSWVTSLLVTGEGTWSVLPTGSLRFSPLPGFSGNSTPVPYRVSDGFGTASAGANAQMAVSAVLPTADPVTGSGARGETVSMSPNGIGPRVALDPASLRLIDPRTELGVESITTPGVGTFVVDHTTGKVNFTPLSEFEGSSTVIYRVTDVLGRAAISTMTVTITPVSLTGETVTVNQGVTARPVVHGVPSGWIFTVPGSVTGASSLTISGSTVIVVPRTGFSGRIVIPITLVHGSTTLTTSLVVLVRPSAVTGGQHSLTARGGTVVHWSGGTGAIAYRVQVNGVTKCVTSARACKVPKLLGPRAKVRVTSVGHDGVLGSTVTAPYRATGCVSIGNVYFSTASATLSGRSRSDLARMAAVVTSQGFTRGCLVGHTDSRASAAYNLALSKHRVDAAGDYLGHRTTHTRYRRVFKGELAPDQNNNTPGGRASNRRVEIGVI